MQQLGRTHNALTLVLELLDDVELTVAQQVCAEWRAHALAIGARAVVCCGKILDEDDTWMEEQRARELFQTPPPLSEKLCVARRWLAFQRRHPDVANIMGTLRSVAAFHFDEPLLVTVVACDGGLILLGPGGAVLQGGVLKTFPGLCTCVRADTSHLYALLGSVYDGMWCTVVVRWSII